MTRHGRLNVARLTSVLGAFLTPAILGVGLGIGASSTLGCFFKHEDCPKFDVPVEGSYVVDYIVGDSPVGYRSIEVIDDTLIVEYRYEGTTHIAEYAFVYDE